MLLQKKTLQLEKKRDNLKVLSIIRFYFQITMQEIKIILSKKSNPDEWEIGLERVVDSKFDKGLEEVIL